MTEPWQPQARPLAKSGPSIGWMLLLSLWLLPVLAGFGYVTWLGFAVIGVVAVRLHWLIAAGAYAVIALVIPIVPIDAVQTVGMPALWVVGIIHALSVNPNWLRTAWSRRERGERLFGRGPVPLAPPRPGTLASPVSATPATAVQSSSVAAAPAPMHAPAAAHATAPAPTGIDPATASVDQLAPLPFMGAARAEYVVAYRGGHPLAGLDDLIVFLRLQPHEAVALRPHLVFGGATPPAPSAPEPPPASETPARPSGRILDV